MDSGGPSGAPGAAAEVLAAMAEEEPPQPPPGQADLQQPPPPPHQPPAQQQQEVGTPQRARRDVDPPTAERPLAVANLWQEKVETLRENLPPPHAVLKLLASALLEMQLLGANWDARTWLTGVLQNMGEEAESIELWAEATFLDERLDGLGGNEKCQCAAAPPPQGDAEEADGGGEAAAAAAAAPPDAACGRWGLQGVAGIVNIALKPCNWKSEGVHIVSAAPPRPCSCTPRHH